MGKMELNNCKYTWLLAKAKSKNMCVYALFSTLPFTCKSMHIPIKGLMMIFICNNLAVFHHSRPNLPQILNFIQNV